MIKKGTVTVKKAGVTVEMNATISLVSSLFVLKEHRLIDCSVFSKHSIASEMQKVHKCMGFCPQFDALFDELTASEHLTLYARLRGVPEKELHKVRGL